MQIHKSRNTAVTQTETNGQYICIHIGGGYLSRHGSSLGFLSDSLYGFRLSHQLGPIMHHSPRSPVPCALCYPCFWLHVCDRYRNSHTAANPQPSLHKAKFQYSSYTTHQIVKTIEDCFGSLKKRAASGLTYQMFSTPPHSIDKKILSSQSIEPVVLGDSAYVPVFRNIIRGKKLLIALSNMHAKSG